MQPNPTAATLKGPSLRINGDIPDFLGKGDRAQRAKVSAADRLCEPCPLFLEIRNVPINPWKYPPDVSLEDLLLVRGRQRRGVDVALRVVVVVAGLRIHSAHRAHHLRS